MGGGGYGRSCGGGGINDGSKVVVMVMCGDDVWWGCSGGCGESFSGDGG